MKRTKETPKARVESGTRIKLRVDSRTLIVVRSQGALDMWMGKYPSAQIVE
jgi:hypothetical protein